jgi:hypothetical protein
LSNFGSNFAHSNQNIPWWGAFSLSFCLSVCLTLSVA